MIFRKPYAFLIKNFRKIHVVLLLLCAFIFYKTMQLNGFIGDFLTYLSYDPYIEPISQYTSFLFYVSTILVISTSVILLVLLRRKGKPWKLYLVPISAYLITFILFSYTQKYFNSYEGELVTTTARAIKDFLFIDTLPQYATFVILLIRITGLDLNKFSFKTDKEFLELEQDDREEFEISVNIDKDAFKRKFKKLQRFIGYFYEEHKFIMNVLIIGLTVFLVGYTYYYFGIAHKTTKETQNLNANGYEIKVNKSFYTDKDKTGNILEEDSSFVILNLTVKNNSGARELNSDNFHLKNGKEDFTFTENTYSNYFKDIGKEYTSRKFRNGEIRTFAMIFKVDKKLNKDNFVLYYQEYKSSTNVYLRKIKIKLEDVSIINTNPTKKLNEELIVLYPNNKKESFTFEKVTFEDNSNYNIESCDEDENCSITTKTMTTSDKYKILKIDFISNSFEGEELIDFSTNYGKIKYVDNENLTKEIKIEDALEQKDYLGKYLYIKVPNEIERSKQIEIIYTIRNQKYFYKIR